MHVYTFTTMYIPINCYACIHIYIYIWITITTACCCSLEKYQNKIIFSLIKKFKISLKKIENFLFPFSFSKIKKIKFHNTQLLC